jgi:hypothetical protein
MARRYETLKLADVYSVIAFYLRNVHDVDAYMETQDHCFDEFAKKHGLHEASRALKQKLLERQAQMKAGQ